jgi:AcrR family transcriptional regulator
MLEAAMELFCDKGYGATSLSDVVKKSGGSLSTLYDLFGNKAGLFRALVEEQCILLTTTFEAPNFADLPTEEGLTIFARGLLEHTLNPRINAGIRAIAAEAMQFPELGEMFFESGPERGTTIMAAYLKEQERRGRLAIDNPKQAAEDFCTLLCGDARLRNMFGLATGFTPDNTEAKIARSVRLFMKAYSPDPA